MSDRVLNICLHVEVIDQQLPNIPSQPTIACSKSTIETLEQGVRYVSS